MARSGYTDDCWGWDLIRWRGAVAAAIRGKRGQAFLLEMWKALQSRPEQKLIAGDLYADGEVCAIGSVGLARRMDMSKIDPEDHEALAAAFGIPHTLACEIMFMNDDDFSYGRETPEARWTRMREWIEENLLPVDDVTVSGGNS